MTPPVISNFRCTSTTSTSASFAFSTDENGVYYYLIGDAGVPVPTADYVRSNGIKGGSAFRFQDNIFSSYSLHQITEYTAYLVEEDASGNLSVLHSVAFNTKIYVPTIVTGTSPNYTATIETTTGDGITNTAIIITPTSDDANDFALTCTLIRTALSEAQSESETYGTTAQLEIRLNIPETQTDFSVTIHNTCFGEIAADGIACLTVTSPQVSVSFDAAALDAISASADGDITVSAERVAVSAAVSAEIGGRPVYSLSDSTGGDEITSFGGGTATVSIAIRRRRARISTAS